MTIKHEDEDFLCESQDIATDVAVVEHINRLVDSVDYYIVCGVCELDVDSCQCPECPLCGSTGGEDCLLNGGVGCNIPLGV